jgi:hypothetical protein
MVRIKPPVYAKTHDGKQFSIRLTQELMQPRRDAKNLNSFNKKTRYLRYCKQGIVKTQWCKRKKNIFLQSFKLCASQITSR